MDKTLAEIYGTNVSDEADVEKLAAAQLAEELAEDGSVDLTQYSDDEIEALAAEVVGDEDEEAEKTAGAEDEVDEESMAKLAEADKAGRVMAHAFVQEVREIEKNAGLADKARAAGAAIKGAFGRAGARARGAAAAGAAKAKETGGKVGKHLKDNKKAYGIGAGVAAASGGAGFAAGRKTKKASAETELSALDRLAIQRAEEILAENGIELPTEEAEKTATTKAEVLQAAVEARAVEILTAHGVKFEE